MKLQITLVLEYNLPNEKARARYQTEDPQLVASEMTREAQEMADDLNRNGVTMVGCVVTPLYG